MINILLKYLPKTNYISNKNIISSVYLLLWLSRKLSVFVLWNSFLPSSTIHAQYTLITLSFIPTLLKMLLNIFINCIPPLRHAQTMSEWEYNSIKLYLQKNQNLFRKMLQDWFDEDWLYQNNPSTSRHLHNMHLCRLCRDKHLY